MWKLLIAEDETTIRKGLRFAADWNDYSIDVIGEAEDGEIALSMAIELKPHILFVDINMPFLNGLELMEQLRKNLPDAIFIVISGYDEFGYAQQAIKMGAFDYLIKPVNKGELIKTVKRAADHLEKNSRSKRLAQQLEGNKPLLKEKFLQNWCSGSLSSEEVDEQCQLLEIKLDGHIGMSIFKVVRGIDDGGAERYWSDSLISFSLKNIVKQMLNAYPNVELFEDHSGNIVVLVPDVNMEQLLMKNREIKEYTEKFLGKVIVCAENMFDDHLAFPKQYTQLMNEIKTSKSLSPMVLLAKNYIDQHYYEHSISLKEVAAIVQVSPTYLSKQIKNELGVSFIHYLTKVRINKALLLIKDPYLKIYEVADMVGYSTQHYFCSAFKKVIGISPMVYKSGVRSND
ncbi:response regulator transcription factor [Peribacillus muralis]|uniref:response regulator transcription factor n=1 Tax=Peribacillus muralis TaxID=264697 RepID=UPI00070FDED9|nr:response regulator [Peribacillus muralis]